ncbi:cytochrome P450 monooxygenase [Aspergillus steynii IBT 23096]|uniref:Cytochrome P450 monooxygenase n=1 Tax=Aspergillus steynii IBT 23096 TaxID=1392250 RepID=A0A2I2FW01_9EURO|nr:cytochrome P450 monooxygenase [Aspergillus steynii IBT 23096]PLB44787.1 cytochrome P450 monooxygenase [Aspergillus steynii IBT 23096]
MSLVFEIFGYSPTIALVLFLLLPLLAAYLYTQLYYYRFKQHASWPQPQPSLLWGHLKVMHQAIQEYAELRRTDAALTKIWESLGKPSAFILDLRPAERVLCIVASHEVAEQFVQPSKQFPYSVSKSPTMQQFTDLIGKGPIITREEMEWKMLRKRFNPGFAFPHLIGLLPVILDRVWRFMDQLDVRAQSGEVFRFGDLCNSVTYEIICAVTLGVDLNNQSDVSRQSEIGRLYWKLLSSYLDGDSAIFWTDPRIKRRRKALAAKLNPLIKTYVEEKFFDSHGKPLTDDTVRISKTIVGLSLRGTEELTPDILDSTCDQVKVFLFAGQDTTSTLLQWATYELSRTPHVLKALHAELDRIFGPNSGPGDIRQRLISEGAVVIGQMSYLSAIIKETLRLHPPGATARMAAPGSGESVRLTDGQQLYIDGLIIYNCLSMVQRDTLVYGETRNDFMPERWLNKTEMSSFPATAWRPFERGPRSCIGQELANIEARVILACIVRRYDFSKVGLGETDYSANGEPTLNNKGQYKVLSELYDAREVTLKPVDGMRMRVKFSPKVHEASASENVYRN